MVTVEKFMVSPAFFSSHERIMIGPLTYIINIITPFVLSFSHSFFVFFHLEFGKMVFRLRAPVLHFEWVENSDLNQFYCVLL